MESHGRLALFKYIEDKSRHVYARPHRKRLLYSAVIDLYGNLSDFRNEFFNLKDGPVTHTFLIN